MNVARGLALFFGVFTFVNLAGEFRFATASLNLWWIDAGFLPFAARTLAFAILGIALLWFAIAPASAQRHRAIVGTILLLATIIAIVNAITYYSLLSRRVIASLLPIPFSAFVACALLVILLALRLDRGDRSRRFLIAVTAIASAILFPLLQFALFGLTDYRRPADLAVVFGARAYANGRASPTLADRVREGCRVYQQGLAPRLLFSGGAGDGAIDEPHAMQSLATSLGIPSSAILLDANGINTEATIRNTEALTRGRPMRILMVSDFYHLPRIKMAAQRHGLQVFTVPARTSVPQQMPWNVSREAVAFWAYYLRHLR